ncbi:MAG: hypothetical protein FWE05_12020 [Defluviitaleaceae bacterium]|nr:hypothetical protein [Defluviitaleaceae bacterium]
MIGASKYEWLIVVEGSTDKRIYEQYLSAVSPALSFKVIQMSGKRRVLNMHEWSPSDKILLDTNIGRNDFKGIILIIDTDSSNKAPFRDYYRGDYAYIGDKVAPMLDNSGSFWELDILQGIVPLPIRGVNVPLFDSGCLESDFLNGYGFPINEQPEYSAFVDIIKKATQSWSIASKSNGRPWYEDNEKAKMDKFMYAALQEGFTVSGKKPIPPQEPEIIKNIRLAMNGVL